MVRCNMKLCGKEGAIKICDGVDKQWIHLCRTHADQYSAGVLKIEGIDIDFYSKWDNCPTGWNEPFIEEEDDE